MQGNESPENTPETKKPKYRNVANAISARIISGELPTGTKLPPRDEIAADYDVSVVTVRQALAVLRDNGLVDPRHGAGTFVTYTPEPEPEADTDVDEPKSEPPTYRAPDQDPVQVTRIEENTESPVEFNIQVTQQDGELQAIEATLVLLQMLPYETRVRAITYIRDRIESDPNVWSPPAPPSTPPLQPVSRREVAQALAEADDRVWADMTPIGQSSYYRRAEALTESFAVVRDGR